MTQQGKFYWLRHPSGLLFGRSGWGNQSMLTPNPLLALVSPGGPELDEFLTTTASLEPIEVRQNGRKHYHGREVDVWVPVPTGRPQ